MKNLVLILSFLLITQYASAQNDTIVYYRKHSPLTSVDGADEKVEVRKKKKNLSIMITSSLKDGKWNVDKTERIKLEKNGQYCVTNGDRYFTRYFTKIEGGFQVQDYNQYGSLESGGMSRSLFPLSPVNQWTYFYSKTSIGVDFYREENLVESYHKINNKHYPTNTYINADSLASYEGGEEVYSIDLSKKINYPLICEQNGITGRVLIFFSVDIDGIPGDFQILSDTDKYLNKAAISAVASCDNWNPAIKDGKPIKVYSVVPINFQLR